LTGEEWPVGYKAYFIKIRVSNSEVKPAKIWNFILDVRLGWVIGVSKDHLLNIHGNKNWDSQLYKDTELKKE